MSSENKPTCNYVDIVQSGEETTVTTDRPITKAEEMLLNKLIKDKELQKTKYKLYTFTLSPVRRSHIEDFDLYENTITFFFKIINEFAMVRIVEDGHAFFIKYIMTPDAGYSEQYRQTIYTPCPCQAEH